MKLPIGIRFTPILVTFTMLLNQLTKPVAADDWTTWELGNLGLSVELPGKPRMDNFPLAKSFEKLITDHMGYRYTDADMGVFILYLSVARVTQKEIEVLPGLIATAAVSRAAASSSVSGLRYTTEKVGSRVVLKANFEMKGISFEVQGFVVSRGRNIWSVMTIYDEDKDAGRTNAERVLGSVEITSK